MPQVRANLLLIPSYSLHEQPSILEEPVDTFKLRCTVPSVAGEPCGTSSQGAARCFKQDLGGFVLISKSSVSIKSSCSLIRQGFSACPVAHASTVTLWLCLLISAHIYSTSFYLQPKDLKAFKTQLQLLRLQYTIRLKAYLKSSSYLSNSLCWMFYMK